MNTLARNFSHTFRRFFTASVLNIIGLAIAFASFFVIMTQVDYDLNLFIPMTTMAGRRGWHARYVNS